MNRLARARLWSIGLWLLLLATPCVAQQTVKICLPIIGSPTNSCQDISLTFPFPIEVIPYLFTPVASSQFALGVVTSTALTVPATATQALVCVEGAAVRWADDGTAPTATVGQPLIIGQCKAWSGSLSAIRFIQQAATATINVSYYK